MTAVNLNVGTLREHPVHAQLLGNFLSRWSLVEFTLVMPLMLAFKSNKQGVATAVLSSTNSAEAKITLVRNAVDNSDIDSTTKKEINGCLARFAQLCKTRNAYSHHVWAVEVATKDVFTIDFRKSAGKDSRRIKREYGEILKICNDLSVLAKDICKATKSNWITDQHVEELLLEVSETAEEADVKPANEGAQQPAHAEDVVMYEGPEHL